MNGLELAGFVLLPCLSVGISVVTAIVLLTAQRARPRSARSPNADAPDEGAEPHPSFLPRPDRWLAVKRRTPAEVQAALGLHNPRSCSWLEGLMGEEQFFIAPLLKGWVVVIGSGLPDPAADVDGCFRFLLCLSRKLGHVQFFSSNRPIHHHAWVWAKGGRVVRAYAWAGKTLWTQGSQTPAERDLGLKCFDYADATDGTLFGQSERVAANVDKLPLLAARWSLDPAHLGEWCVGQEHGIAGERS